MKSYLKTTRETISPIWLFLFFICTTFLVETSVMFALPLLMPQEYGIALDALVDSFSLTLILGPFVWIAFIGPIQRASRLRAKLLDWVLQVQEEERGRISRDLHDGIGQLLTSLMVGLRVVEESSREETTKEQIIGLRKQGASIHEELRRLVKGLRPLVLDDVGLVPAIERLVGETSTLQKVKIQFQTNLHEFPRIPPTLETTLYRTVQEALNNALKHANPSWIQIELLVKGRELTLAVVDNGKGFWPDNSSRESEGAISFGLLTMKERFAQFGGEVQIESRPGTGTRVKGRCPFEIEKGQTN